MADDHAQRMSGWQAALYFHLYSPASRLTHSGHVTVTNQELVLSGTFQVGAAEFEADKDLIRLKGLPHSVSCDPGTPLTEIVDIAPTGAPEIDRALAETSILSAETDMDRGTSVLTLTLSSPTISFSVVKQARVDQSEQAL